MEIEHVDVCVVGGGPAGSATALRLAQLGHRVCIVERTFFPRFHVGESLTRGVWTLFDILGVRQSVLKQDFLFAKQTLVRWDKPETEKLTYDVPGLLVDRGRFDALLLKEAELAGVRVIQPARAGITSLRDSVWQVEVRFESETRLISADYLVDATGRRSFMPGPRKSISPPTVALCGHFSALGRRQPTCIEAVADGWCWGASVPGERFSAMVFLSPDTVRRRRAEGLEELWRSQLANTELFAEVAGLPLVHPIVAQDAVSDFATDFIGPNFLRVGEASFTLDPLSSTGVEKSMQTGCIAAIAVHTMILRPERIELCIKFCRERHNETVSAHAAWSADFYRRVERFGDRPFWLARSLASVGGSSTRPTPSSSFRDRPIRLTTQVQVSSKARLVKEPCIIDDEMCERAALLHPNLDRPVAFVDGVELERLLALVPQSMDFEALLTLWSTRVSAEEAKRVAGWLMKNQILEQVS